MSNPWSVVGLTLVMAGSAAGQTRTSNEFPDTPANHWVYQARRDFESVGLLFDVPDLHWGGFSQTRYKLAISTYASCVGLADQVCSLQRDNEAVARLARPLLGADKGVRETLRRLRSMLPTIQTDLIKLTREFTSELRNLGVEIENMEAGIRRDCQAIATFHIAKPGEASSQFTDVPEGHWAAQAVQSLRAAGILHGYDGTRFRG